MGGISSNGSTVQVELIGDRNSISQYMNEQNWTQPPEAIFLEDKLLKIYSMKPQGKKQIDITNATLEQIFIFVILNVASIISHPYFRGRTSKRC